MPARRTKSAYEARATASDRAAAQLLCAEVRKAAAPQTAGEGAVRISRAHAVHQLVDAAMRKRSQNCGLCSDCPFRDNCGAKRTVH